jgi:hypothetical protein
MDTMMSTEKELILNEIDNTLKSLDCNCYDEVAKEAIKTFAKTLKENIKNLQTTPTKLYFVKYNNNDDGYCNNAQTFQTTLIECLPTEQSLYTAIRKRMFGFRNIIDIKPLN